MVGGVKMCLWIQGKDRKRNRDWKSRRYQYIRCLLYTSEQSAEYKESVLPKDVRKRVAIEALGEFGWGRYVGLDGACVTMKGFGASGPAAQLFEKFGFTVENVVNTVKAL